MPPGKLWFPFALVERKTGLPGVAAGCALAGMDQLQGLDAQPQACGEGAAAEIEIIEMKGKLRIKAKRVALQHTGSGGEENAIQECRRTGGRSIAGAIPLLRAAVVDYTHQTRFVTPCAAGLQPPGHHPRRQATIAGDADQIELPQCCAQAVPEIPIPQPDIVVAEGKDRLGISLGDGGVVGQGEGRAIAESDSLPIGGVGGAGQRPPERCAAGKGFGAGTAGRNDP